VTSPALPEVQRFIGVLDHLLAAAPDKQRALDQLAVASAHAGGPGDTTGAFVTLMTSLDSLEGMVQERFSESGRREAALHLIQLTRSLLDLDDLVHPWEAYRARRYSVMQSARGMFVLLSDLKFDGEALLEKSLTLSEEISSLKKKFAGDDELSDAARAVLFCQLDLLHRSVARFQTSGVGPFRDSIFSSVGRIYIELAQDSGVSPDKVRSVIDDMLRVVNLAQVGGSILKLSGPVIAGLIEGPK